MRKGLPIGIIVCGALILVASFLPGVTIVGPLQIQGGAEPNPLQSLAQAASHLFGGQEISMTVNAWNGNVSLGGITLPNWLVVAVGLIVTGVFHPRMSAAHASTIRLAVLPVGVRSAAPVHAHGFASQPQG